MRFQLTQIRFGLLQFTQMFITYANLNEPLLLHPDLSNSTQVRVKLFQLPKFDLKLLEFAQMLLIVSKFQ